MAETKRITEIAEKEESSMVSTWIEILCLIEFPEGFEIRAMGREVLGEVNECSTFDDDGEYILPDEVKGKEVYGVEDDWLVGVDLLPRDDECFTFLKGQFPSQQTIESWLTKAGWSEEIATDILSALPEVDRDE